MYPPQASCNHGWNFWKLIGLWGITADLLLRGSVWSLWASLEDYISLPWQLLSLSLLPGAMGWAVFLWAGPCIMELPPWNQPAMDWHFYNLWTKTNLSKLQVFNIGSKQWGKWPRHHLVFNCKDPFSRCSHIHRCQGLECKPVLGVNTILPVTLDNKYLKISLNICVPLSN